MVPLISYEGPEQAFNISTSATKGYKFFMGMGFAMFGPKIIIIDKV